MKLEDIFFENKIKIIKKTLIKKTKAEQFHLQADFLNQGFLVETCWLPQELLSITQTIETKMGRKKIRKDGPRVLDLDIIWVEGEIVDTRNLNIPHRRNRNREWVRQFICDLKSDLIDPQTGVHYKTMNVKAIKSIHDFKKKKNIKEKITVLTCYDYTMASLLAATSVDCILVGDSLGSVMRGIDGTVGVTLEDIIYHSQCVRSGMPDTFIIADMPFLAAHRSSDKVLKSAGKLIQQGLANAVKVEGGFPVLKKITKLVEAGIPVMGHLGLLPQAVEQIGGFKLQGKTQDDRTRILEEALALQKAGVFSIVLEMIPSDLAQEISEKLNIPTIGIGAGSQTDGQVLVIQDMLGMNHGFAPKFLRKFGEIGNEIQKATELFCADVRKSTYPSDRESY